MALQLNTYNPYLTVTGVLQNNFWTNGDQVLADPSLQAVTGAITGYASLVLTSGQAGGSFSVGFGGGNIPSNATFVSGCVLIWGNVNSTGRPPGAGANPDVYLCRDIFNSDFDNQLNIDGGIQSIPFDIFRSENKVDLVSDVKKITLSSGQLNSAASLGINKINSTSGGIIFYHDPAAYTPNYSVTYRFAGAQFIAYYHTPESLASNTIYMYKTSTISRIGVANMKY